MAEISRLPDRDGGATPVRRAAPACDGLGTRGAGGGRTRLSGRCSSLRTLLLALGLLPLLSGCSLGYYARGAAEGWKILRTRTPVPQVIADPATDTRTRGKLALAREALAFADSALGLPVDGSYSSVVFLPDGPLAHIVSASPPDRLAAYTWKFPIVGRVPYKGFFRLEDAEAEEARLAGAGYDTNLRPTSAFSTLGILEDPIPSTLLRYDEVALVETLFHELSHQFLFVPGQVRFNESFAQFAGNVGAVQFFCTRAGGGPDTVWCHRARARWRDEQRFSAFLDPLVAELEALYADPSLSREEKVARREPIFAGALERFDRELTPTLEALSYRAFRTTPLNNATLLGRMRYYHRLGDFQRLHEESEPGDLAGTLLQIRTALEAPGAKESPFAILDALGPGPATP